MMLLALDSLLFLKDPDAWLPSGGELERWSLCGDDDREHEGAEGEQISV